MPSRLAPSKLPKCCYLLFPRDLRPRSYQSVATSFPPVLRLRSYESVVIYRFFHPTCALEVTKVSPLSFSFPACALEVTNVLATFAFLSCLVPSKLPKCFFSRFPYLTCALKVTKVSLLSCPPPVLRPRSYQSVIVSWLFPPDSRPRSLAPFVFIQSSKIPKCRCSSFCPPYLRPRSYQSVMTSVFPSCLARSKLPKCRYFSFSPPDLRSRGYQSVSSFVPPLPSCALEVTKVSLFRGFSHLARTLEVTKVSLLSCYPPVLRPRSYQSVAV